ncbi:Rv3235 family protein [Arthrobacter sp. 35W]|uniref:Rv3235 family protein n=1 Tax=Arthrobacter sp. 35W TaxID=1132441 RepID=UPI0003FFD6FF|nr:Rv3235 family protein [Arthrobacter sp. 35W]
MNASTAPAAAATPIRTRPAPVADGGGLAPVLPLPQRLRPATAAPGAQYSSVAAVVLDPARAEAVLVREMAKKIGQASVEVLAGTRPIQQLARWLDARSFDALLVRATLVQAAQRAADAAAAHNNVTVLHHNPLVRSVHCCPVAPGVYESSLVIAEHHRARAVAMRLEQFKGAWKVTALEIG